MACTSKATETKDQMNGTTKVDSEWQNVWSSILRQVQENVPNKLPSHKQILVMGDNESGKTTLITKMHGNQATTKGSGLEYSYVHVRDEYRDDHTRLGVWILDGDPWHRNLLKFVLTTETIEDTTVLITTSMTTPWTLLDSLHSWATLLEEHLSRLRLPPSTVKKNKGRVLRRFEDYIEPGDKIDAVSWLLRRTSAVVGDNTLTNNLGIDVIVVITKTDCMSTLEKQYDFKDDHFNFIQQAVRKFCLRYGAALFYTSAKEDKNCDLLYQYLVHRVYGFPFKTPALVLEKDGVFVPSGWDSDKKIAILQENITSVSLDDPFSGVIPTPMTRKPLQREPDVVAEDDQAFLERLQALMNQQVPTSKRTTNVAARTPVSVQKSAKHRLSRWHGQPNPTKKETEFAELSQVGGAEGSGEVVLQNFFTCLLNRKTVAGGTPIRMVDKSLTTTDAAAELERIGRSVGKSTCLSPATSSADHAAPGSATATTQTEEAQQFSNSFSS